MKRARDSTLVREREGLPSGGISLKTDSNQRDGCTLPFRLALLQNESKA